jgi:hypothetical protein
MPPVPGRPVLPDGVYPVDYDALCNLSGKSTVFFFVGEGYLTYWAYTFSSTFPHTPEARANIIMDSFDLNGPNNENANADMRDKILSIATFMGASMKDDWWAEYDKWDAEREVEREVENVDVSK